MSVELPRHHIEVVKEFAIADLRRARTLVEDYSPRGEESLHPVDKAIANMRFIKELFTPHVSAYFERTEREVRLDRKVLGFIPPITFIWPFGGDRFAVDRKGDLYAQVPADSLIGGPFFGPWVQVDEQVIRDTWDQGSKKSVRHIANLKRGKIIRKLLQAALNG